MDRITGETSDEIQKGFSKAVPKEYPKNLKLLKISLNKIPGRFSEGAFEKYQGKQLRKPLHISRNYF